MAKKTYKDFGDAVDELRIKADLSYDRMALGVDIAQSYLYHIINRRKASAPKDDIIKKIAEFFHVPPSYFYEYRLRRLLDFLNNNREYLDHCLRQAKRLDKKVSDMPEATLEEFEDLEDDDDEDDVKKSAI
jgi:transcriptional regulator with XRE-family HTH domain